MSDTDRSDDGRTEIQPDGMDEWDDPADADGDERPPSTRPKADLDLDPAEYAYEIMRHRNGDETAVLLTAFGDGWQVLVVEVAADGEVLETEALGHTDDSAKAAGMAEYWVHQNPKGLLGAVDDEDSGGIMNALGFGGGDA